MSTLVGNRTVVSVAGATVAAFQLALAAGAPWGAASWGGRNAGVLPPSLRLGSVASALLWGGVTALAITAPVPATGWRRPVLRVVAVLSGINALMNLASPSLPERLLWTPVAALLSVGLWQLASGSTPRSGT